MTKKIHFYIYDLSSVFLNTFRKYLSEHPLACPKVTVTILPPASTSGDATATVLEVLEKNSIDALVSPANSFGLMEGGFDLIISKVFLEFAKNAQGGTTPDLARTATDVTRAVQLQLVKHHKMAYNPVQSIVRINGNELVEDILETSGGGTSAAHAPPPYTRRDTGDGAAYTPPDLLLVPAMSRPKQLEINSHTKLHESVIFNSIWNLLSLLAETHLNNTSSPNPNVFKVLITGLGTGVGGVAHEVAAFHMYKALSIYAKALHLQSTHPTAISKLIQNEIK